MHLHWLHSVTNKLLLLLQVSLLAYRVQLCKLWVNTLRWCRISALIPQNTHTHAYTYACIHTSAHKCKHGRKGGMKGRPLWLFLFLHTQIHTYILTREAFSMSCLTREGWKNKHRKINWLNLISFGVSSSSYFFFSFFRKTSQMINMTMRTPRDIPTTAPATFPTSLTSVNGKWDEKEEKSDQ